jgi:superfamily I DNA/RNA helicase
VFPTDDGDRALVEAHRDDIDIVDLLPPEWVEGHLTVVSLLSRITDGEDLDNGEAQLLANQTGRVVDELASLLGAGDGDEGGAGAGGHERDPDAPTIVCTSLVGAKGLSAGHVFVVGLNDGHFPRDAGGITDDEMCQFLVALSRTRGRCHLISAGRLGAQPLARSRFLGWVSAHTLRRTVNADYFK